jgi:hypothetical protein
MGLFIFGYGFFLFFWILGRIVDIIEHVFEFFIVLAHIFLIFVVHLIFIKLVWLSILGEFVIELLISEILTIFIIAKLLSLKIGGIVGLISELFVTL